MVTPSGGSSRVGPGRLTTLTISTSWPRRARLPAVTNVVRTVPPRAWTSLIRNLTLIWRCPVPLVPVPPVCSPDGSSALSLPRGLGCMQDAPMSESTGSSGPATSYASGTSAVPLLGETIGANLARTVARFPDREALVDRATGRRLSYAELAAGAAAVARGLHATGVGKGDRVGIWAPNCVEWVLVQY